MKLELGKMGFTSDMANATVSVMDDLSDLTKSIEVKVNITIARSDSLAEIETRALDAAKQLMREALA